MESKVLGVKNEGAGDLPALFCVQRGEVVSDALADRLDGTRIAFTKERSRCTALPSLVRPRRACCGPRQCRRRQNLAWPSGAKLGGSPEATAGYDADLLVAALEDIELRRAAIEWLLEADLLCVCLV